MPAVTTDGVLRFDPETTTAYAARWVATSNEFTKTPVVVFTGAVTGATASLALVSAIIAMSF